MHVAILVRRRIRPHERDLELLGAAVDVQPVRTLFPLLLQTVGVGALYILHHQAAGTAVEVERAIESDEAPSLGV